MQKWFKKTVIGCYVSQTEHITLCMWEWAGVRVYHHLKCCMCVCVCVSSLKMYSHLCKCRVLHIERVFLCASGSGIVRMGTLYCVRHRMISLCIYCTLQKVSFWFWPIFDTFSRAFIQSDMHDTERFVWTCVVVSVCSGITLILDWLAYFWL